MTPVYNKWIEHDGLGCPVVGFLVDTVHDPINQPTVTETHIARGGESWYWENYKEYTKIIRYRVHKPKGAEMLEAMLVDLPVEVVV